MHIKCRKDCAILYSPDIERIIIFRQLKNIFSKKKNNCFLK
jgi:hypothetical protein